MVSDRIFFFGNRAVPGGVEGHFRKSGAGGLAGGAGRAPLRRSDSASQRHQRGRLVHGQGPRPLQEGRRQRHSRRRSRQVASADLFFLCRTPETRGRTFFSREENT